MAEKADVSVGVGSVYRWELVSNPTTGYGWYLVSDEGLKVETEFIPKSDLCGAPGTHVFIISSNVKGTFTLTAEYKRQWEKVPPSDTRKLTISFE
jgi:predicted secreted protein